MRLFNKTALAMAAIGLITVGATTNVMANNHHKHHNHHNHEKVREAFASGQVMSLKDVLSKIEKDFPGEVIEIEFEKGKGDNFVYDIKMLRDDGSIMKLKVDAANADIIKTKTRDKDQRMGNRHKSMDGKGQGMRNKQDSMGGKGQNMEKNHQRMTDNHKRMEQNHQKMGDKQERMNNQGQGMGNKGQGMNNQGQGMGNKGQGMNNQGQGMGNKQSSMGNKQGNMGNNSQNN